MKPKNLSKKIRRLEVRLQKGAKKLAKLNQKLEAAMAASAAKKKRKSAVRAGEVRKSRIQTAAVKRPSAVKKVKRKLNLTPERRAQLAAAMKARWAAKRAAADATTQTTSTEPGFRPGQAPQPQ